MVRCARAASLSLLPLAAVARFCCACLGQVVASVLEAVLLLLLPTFVDWPHPLLMCLRPCFQGLQRISVWIFETAHVDKGCYINCGSRETDKGILTYSFAHAVLVSL